MRVHAREVKVLEFSQDKDPLLEHLTTKICELIPDGHNLSLLDIGCGTGRTSIKAAKKGYNVEGIDVEKKVIQIALKHTKGMELSKQCRFQTGDFTYAKKFNRLFDVIICSEVLEHVADPIVIIKKANIFLRPGGLLVITVPHGMKQWSVLDVYAEHYRRFERSELRQMIENVNDLKIETEMTIGFPFMKTVIWVYTKALKVFGRAHGEHLSSSIYGKVYPHLMGFLLRIDDLFNWTNQGTTLIVKIRKNG